jgi:hypothetical protein
METKSDKTKNSRFPYIIITAIGIAAFVAICIARITYPPVAIFFSHSDEFKMYYRKCMEIQQGQTMQEVKSTMSDFRLASQTSNSLVFNTQKFSADLCSVHFSDGSVPHVESVRFELD